jgi:RNA recognition motif-containing protein
LIDDRPLVITRIFVRNLPFDATAEDLEGVCSAVGPVKRASIIQEKGVSKGFGFVKFAIEDDAARAAEALDGTDFRGRTLRVEGALGKGDKPAGVPERRQGSAAQADPDAVPEERRERPKAQEQPPRAEKQGKKRARRPEGGQLDHHALLFLNLSESTTDKQLYKRIKKVHPPLSIEVEVSLPLG